MNSTFKKWISLLFLGIVYVLAFFLGIVAFTFMTNIHELWRLLVITLTATVVLYIVSLVFKTASIIDPFWSVQTPVLMIFMMLYYNAYNLGTALYFLVFSFWALRLTINFIHNYTRITYEDWRYTILRKKLKLWFYPLSFLSYIGIAVIVFIASLPMYFYILELSNFGLWQMAGLCIMALGAFINAVADKEMRHFRKNRSLKSQVYDKKLWKNSRHPNYYGEIILWLGTSFVLISCHPERFYMFVCAIPVILMYLGTIALAEHYYVKNKPDYAIYKKNTHMLIIAPKKKKYDYNRGENMKWVTFYGNAQSFTKPEPAKYAKDITLRYPIFVPFDGNQIRLTLDNYCINETAYIEAVTVGKGDSLSDKASDFLYLTFNGERRFEIPSHGQIVSDPLPYELKEDTYLVVSIYIKDYTNLMGGVDIIGPLSKGYYAYGNQIEEEKLNLDSSKSTSWVYFISNVDIWTDDTNSCVVCYGDSITSQDWPDYMELALREQGIKNIAVVRKAVSGTRILREYNCITYQSYGLKGEKRFNHELGSVSGCDKVIIQHGINDIIHPVGTDVNIFRPMSDMPTVDDLIQGLEYYKSCAKRMNLKVYVGNLLPIYNWRTYAPFREEIKNGVNEYIKKEENFIDFENEIGIKEDSIWKFAEGMDSGDHLHPSKKAYERMGKLAAKKITE